jgi:hypothetical protein
MTLIYQTSERKIIVLPAAESNALRIQSDLNLGPLERLMASIMALCSSGESRAFTIVPRNLAFATFGLPIFLLIK